MPAWMRAEEPSFLGSISMCERHRHFCTMSLVSLVVWRAAARVRNFQARMWRTREKCGWSLRIGLTDSEDFYMSVCEIDPVVDGRPWPRHPAGPRAGCWLSPACQAFFPVFFSNPDRLRQRHPQTKTQSARLPHEVCSGVSKSIVEERPFNPIAGVPARRANSKWECL